MKIGLFGGTFNPVHNGHLLVAQTVLQKLNLDKIIFLPAGDPPHKDCDLIDKEHRYNMLAIALFNNSNFQISPIEMLPEYQYSYQTIEYFLTNQPNDEIFFIIGMDSLNNLHKWKKGLALLDMCKFVVVTRPGEKADIFHKNIIFVDEINIGISATMVRERLGNRQSIKYLVPERVEKYILNENIRFTREKA